MKAIRTKYHGPTNTRGSRIVATAEGGPRPHRVTVGYNHGSDNPHRDAALALCRKMGWHGTLCEGGLPDGSVAWVFVDKAEHVVVLGAVVTRERAREILRRVWVDGVSITAEQWAELEGLPGETAFERCMGAAGIPRWESVMALPWPERAHEVEHWLNNAERAS